MAGPSSGVGGGRTGPTKGSWASLGSVADFDFANNRYSGPAITVSNASGGYVDDAAGNWTLVPPNTLRRSNKGVLVEGAQTNSIRNNSMQGAVLGQSQNAIRNNSMQGAVVGTPGTLPTNWGVPPSGVNGTVSVVGVGTDASGIDYIDVRYTGTGNNAGAYAFFERASSTPAAPGQTWTASVYTALVAGDVSAASISIGVAEGDTNTTIVANDAGKLVSLTPALTRSSIATTLSNQAVAFVRPQLRVAVATNAVFDFTIRIGSPQLEQAPGAGPVTRTTGTAAAFAGGTMPANWASSPVVNGISRQVAGIGTENGIEYVDIRFFGTTTTQFGGLPMLYTEAALQIAAASGQLWTHSAFAYIVSGSANNLTSLNLDIVENNSSASGLAAGGTVGIAGATSGPLGLRRAVGSRTLNNASTAFVTQRLTFSTAASGAVIDITIRIGWPQLEQWSTSVTTVGGASSPIRTVGTAATRAADTVTATGIAGPMPGTVSAVYRAATYHVFNGNIFALSDGLSPPINRMTLRNSGATVGAVSSDATIASIGQANPALWTGVAADGQRHAVAYAFASLDQANTIDGAAVRTSVPNSSGAPTLNTLVLGTIAGTNVVPFNSYVERIAIYPTRQSNANLQQLSTLANWGG